MDVVVVKEDMLGYLCYGRIRMVPQDLGTRQSVNREGLTAVPRQRSGGYE